MEDVISLISLVAALVGGRLLFPIIFEDFDDFAECLKFTFQWDIISIFKGEYFRDVGKSFKMSVYVIMILVIGLAVNHWLLSLFQKLAV